MKFEFAESEVNSESPKWVEQGRQVIRSFFLISIELSLFRLSAGPDEMHYLYQISQFMQFAFEGFFEALLKYFSNERILLEI